MNSRTDDPTDDPEELNRGAVVSLALFVVLAIIGLFILPVFERTLGLSFRPAFALTLLIEFVAFIGVSISVLRLHRERTYE